MRIGLALMACGVLLASAVEARSLRDRSADRAQWCDPDAPLPPGSGIDACSPFGERQQLTTQMPLQAEPPREQKPLWVPPLAPAPNKR